MAKHIGDIFGYERGYEIRKALSSYNMLKGNSIAKEAAVDFNEFIKEREWNNVQLQINPEKVKVTKEDYDVVIVQMGIEVISEGKSSTEIMNAISDVEDLVDAAVHEIEDFDGVFVYFKMDD